MSLAALLESLTIASIYPIVQAVLGQKGSLLTERNFFYSFISQFNNISSILFTIIHRGRQEN